MLWKAKANCNLGSSPSPCAAMPSLNHFNDCMSLILNDMLHKSRDGHLAQKLEILWYCVVYTIHMVTYHDIYSICVHVFVLFQILVRTLPLYPPTFNTKEASPSLLTMARSLVSEVVDGPNYHGPSLAAVPSRTLFHKLSATPCIHIVFWWSSQLATASQPWL